MPIPYPTLGEFTEAGKTAFSGVNAYVNARDRAESLAVEQARLDKKAAAKKAVEDRAAKYKLLMDRQSLAGDYAGLETESTVPGARTGPGGRARTSPGGGALPVGLLSDVMRAGSYGKARTGPAAATLDLLQEEENRMADAPAAPATQSRQAMLLARKKDIELFAKDNGLDLPIMEWSPLVFKEIAALAPRDYSKLRESLGPAGKAGEAQMAAKNAALASRQGAASDERLFLEAKNELDAFFKKWAPAGVIDQAMLGEEAFRAELPRIRSQLAAAAETATGKTSTGKKFLQGYVDKLKGVQSPEVPSLGVGDADTIAAELLREP